MKIEINTNKDSYDMWKKIQTLVESDYHCQRSRPVKKLVVKHGGKEDRLEEEDDYVEKEEK